MRDPIYTKVSKYVKSAIASGEMKLGEAIYSEKKLCEILQVSRNTVRRAIRQLVAENILESRQGSGTFVKGLEPTKTICLVNHCSRRLVDNPYSTYYRDIIFGTEAEATRRNCRTMIYSAQINDDVDLKRQLGQTDIAGVLIDGAFQNSNEDADFFKHVFKNAVIVDGDPEVSKLAAVVPDYEENFKTLLAPWKDRSNEVAVICNSNIARNQWRKRCFTRAAEALGMTGIHECDYGSALPAVTLELINHGHLIQEQVSELITKNPIRAIFCTSDQTALYAIKYLKYRGYRIPEDIAVAGAGGMVFSEFTDPSLTTIKVDPLYMTRKAVELLEMLIRHKGRNAVVKIPTRLVCRESMTLK